MKLAGTKPTLHVAFNRSIAGTLRQALKAIGRNERVIGSLDDLSFGPVVDPSSDARVEWIESAMGYDFEEVVHADRGFWEEATSPKSAALAWVCRDDAAEYCAFLEFVWRMKDAPFRVIDATGMEATDKSRRKWKPKSLGVVSAEQMLEAGLVERTRSPAAAEVDAHRRRWARLRAENAPLRIVAGDGLISAAIDHFDPWLMRHASTEWEKGARVVGAVLGELFQSAGCPHASDLWLWSRVRALADRHVLEIEGDVSRIQQSRVRRASTR